MQGPVSEVDVLEHFTVHLEHSAFSIRDIHYINSQSALSLLVRLELADSADIAVLRKELDIAAKKYNLEIQINPLNEAPAASPVYRYILTLLSQQLRPELLTKLFRQLRERSLHVAGISPLEADDLHVFEIEIHAEKPIDRQQLMHGLLELKSEYQLDLALQADDLFRCNKRLICVCKGWLRNRSQRSGACRKRRFTAISPKQLLKRSSLRKMCCHWKALNLSVSGESSPPFPKNRKLPSNPCLRH